jgi:tRNA (guanine-N7-)-methyltransferase
MRLRKKRWAKPELEKDNKVIFAPWEYKGKWKELFSNDFPIHLELGCGRGRFISELANKHKTINFIAIDIYYELLVYVLRKANETHLDNLKIIPINIEYIGEIFAQDEIERLYINFCNPWPNKRHHKRRLTHPNFLKQYEQFLKSDSEIWFKTDNELLFADSLEYFKGMGYSELFKTHDLSENDFNGNIMTEYEEKFFNEGAKIKFGIFKKLT